MFKAKLRYMSFVLVCLFFLCSCASHSGLTIEKKFVPSSRNNRVPVYSFGVGTKDDKTGILITELKNNGAGYDAGLRVDDVITSINGQKHTDKEFRALMHRNKGEAVVVRVVHNGETVEYTITPKFTGTDYPAYRTIFELTRLNDKPVNVAVIITDIKNVTKYQNTVSWEESQRHQAQAAIEARMLTFFSEVNNFSIVERSRMDKVLEEYSINLTGLMSDNARVQIGKMTGATHLYLFSLARYSKDRNGCEDVISGRLVELESGKVVAVDRDGWDCN